MSESTPVTSKDSQPIITDRETSAKSPRKIIVSLDGSEFSFRAADYAINLAKLTAGEIICIHAVVNMP